MSISTELNEKHKESNRFKKIWMRLFHIICNLAALGLVCWCIYKFNKDNDVSLVQYKQYHGEKDNIYPSLTLCFTNPFLDDKLKNIGNGINVKTYSNYLQGLHWDDRLVNVDYDNVTIDLDKYLDDIKIVLVNGSTYDKHGDKSYHVSMRSSSIKCFSFDIPFLQDLSIEYLVVTVKNSIFPYGFRPTHHDFDISTGKGSGFEIGFNFPG